MALMLCVVSPDASVAIRYLLFVSRLTPVWKYGMFGCLFSPNASEAKRRMLSVCPFISFA